MPNSTKINPNTSSTNNNTSKPPSTYADVLKSIQVLHPSRYYTNYSTNQTSSSSLSTTTKQRFSSLLLEYGEQELCDWAVVASSHSNSNDTLASNGGMNNNGEEVLSSSSRFHLKKGSSGGSIHHNIQSSKNNARSGNNYMATISSSNNNNNNNNSSNNSIASNGSAKSIFRAHNHLTKSYSNSSLSLSSISTTNATQDTTINNAVNTNNDKPIKLKPFRKKKRSKPKHDISTKLSSSSTAIATAEGTNAMKSVQGRLYLCTKSIVFEPKEFSRGIIRCPFDKMTIKPFVSENHNKNYNGNNVNGMNSGMHQQQQQKTISFTTTKYVIMKKNNIIKPYTIIDESLEGGKHRDHNNDNNNSSKHHMKQQPITTTFSFTFLFSKPTQFLNICNTIFQNPKQHWNSRLSLTNNNHKNNHHNNNMSAATASSQPTFNIHNLNHLTETPQTTSLQSYILSPLMSKTGCTMITDQYLYFQPIHGVIGINNMNNNNSNSNSNSNTINNHYNSSDYNTSAIPNASSGGRSSSNDHFKVSSWKLSSIIATARRYHGLKDSALELFFHEYDDSNAVTDNIENVNIGNKSSINKQEPNEKSSKEKSKMKKNNDLEGLGCNVHSSSLLIAFESSKDREKVMSLLPKVRYVSDTSVHNNVTVDDDHHQYPQSYEHTAKSNNDEIGEEDDSMTPKLQKQMAIKVFCHTDSSFIKQVMKLWMKGLLSNFDYLLALNSAAGRSFHDLSRYPVFPWVMKDYESEELKIDSNDHSYDYSKVFRDLTKPIGALNEERLLQFQERCRSMYDMEDVASFLYGTHYSAPGYCLYYLVRLMPEHMLCLQNGKYDTPDRLFHSIRHCYSSLLTNPADLKESIPQFYDPRTGVDLLLNLKCLQLGVTQTGTIINDVELPAWANSPKDFLKKNRMALEASYCSKHLPSWIDLIFGEKSRGPRAEEALNVFHPTSYLGPEDIDQMDTEEQKIQAELQATEFGICPDMLFSAPHPKKGGNIDVIDDLFELEKTRPLDSGFHDSYNYDDTIMESKEWELLSREDGIENKPTPHSSNGNFEDSMTPSAEDVPTTSHEKSSLSNEDYQFIDPATNDYETEQDKVRARIPLSGSGDSNRNSDDGFGLRNGSFGARSNHSDTTNIRSNYMSTTPSEDRLEISADQGSYKVNGNTSWKFDTIVSKAVHSDVVSGCHISLGKKKSNITTTSLDGSLMVHILPNYNVGRRGFSSRTEFQPTKQMHSFRSHTSDDPLASLSVIVEGGNDDCGEIAFAGGHDDVIFAYGVNSACGLASVYSHRDAITGIDLLPNQPYGDSEVSLDGTHVMISGSWDATVKLWNVSIRKGEVVTIDKDPILEMFDTESSISSVAGIYGLDGQINIAAGCTDGGLIVWCWDGRDKSVKYQETSRKGFGSCSSVHWAQADKTILYAGFGNGKMASYLLKDGEFYPVGVLDIGSPINCLHSIDQNVLLGCEDGGVRIVKVEKDGHLDHQPVIFPSVAGNNSPPISTIHATKGNNRANATKKCVILCVAGGKDGSVTAFNAFES